MEVEEAVRRTGNHPHSEPAPRGAGILLILLALAVPCLCTGCGATAHGQNAAGVQLYQQGMYQPAIERFQQALYNDPSNADAYYNLAATYHRMGKLNGNQADLDQAENFYNQCLDRQENHRDCYRALAVLLVDEGRSEEAFRLLEGWTTRNPNSAEPRVELARLFEEYGDRGAAKENLIAALAADPNNARALAALGRVREQLGEVDQALADYQRSLWQDRFQPEVTARVAALQQALKTQPLTSPPPAANTGTRTVTNPGAPLR